MYAVADRPGGARLTAKHPNKGVIVNTRTIAIIALVIAVILVLALFVF